MTMTCIRSSIKGGGGEGCGEGGEEDGGEVAGEGGREVGGEGGGEGSGEGLRRVIPAVRDQCSLSIFFYHWTHKLVLVRGQSTCFAVTPEVPGLAILEIKSTAVSSSSSSMLKIKDFLTFIAVEHLW